MQAATRAAFSAVASLTNLKFTEVAPNVLSDMPSAYINNLNAQEAGAYAYLPSEAQQGGDSWYNRGSFPGTETAPKGSYAYFVVFHELGHAFGLKHTHDVDPGFPAFDPSRDSIAMSVMSYRGYPGSALSNTALPGSYSQSFMQLDIATLQTFYGANFSTNSGNTTYRWNPLTGEETINGVSQGTPVSNKILQTIWDGGGVDTYDLSNYTTDLKVDLNPGAFSTFSAAQVGDMGPGDPTPTPTLGNVANALLYQNDARSLIENVIGGTGNDRIVGNKANNSIDGGAGTDTFVVNAPRASVTVVTANGKTTLTSSEGTDTLVNVEKVEFSDGQTITLDTTTTTPTVAPLVSTYTAAALTQFITGADPTADQMTLRTKAASDAFTYYSNVLKVANPNIGPYESLGVSFSYLPDFQTKYGAGAIADNAAFVAKAYQDVFLRAPTAGQQSAFISQITYFTGIYQSTGMAAATALQQARGAVVGQMIGYVMTDPSEANKPGQLIDDKAIAYADNVKASLVGVAADVWVA